MHILDLLEKRGLIEQTTSPDLRKILEKPTNFYVGFDPTADSLHLGNLVPLIVMKWLQSYGHKPHVIIGGATGRVGDPSGKSHERPLLFDADISRNIQKISEFLQSLFEKETPVLLNNDDWYRKMNVVEFLRDVGKQFRLGPMLAKESVKARLQSEEGMSFTEFTYQVLQGYDFYHLHKTYGVVLQIGGSEQWGNITAGIDLTRKLSRAQLFGITFPLLLQSDGKKFGKTEKGAVWLSEDKLTAYDFYQYIYRTTDKDVIRLMRTLTFIDLKEIEKIEQSMQEPSYVPNSAQKRLADELTKFIHKEKGLQKALQATSKIYAKDELTKDTLKKIAEDIPHASYEKDQLVGKKYTEIVASCGLCSSKSEATRFIKNGGAYLNNEKVSDINFLIEEALFIENTYLLLGIGKKKRFLIEIKN